jgi:hypothetical protein
MSIKNECFTVSMQVGVWLGHKLDKTTSAKITTEAGAHADAGRFNKHTVPKESLAAITTRVSALRSHLYANTLPWKDNGDRLLPRKSFSDFMFAHETLRNEFYTDVEDFLNRKYAAAREQAEFRMGELFNDDDYPTVPQLRQKFYVMLDIDGIADAKDFRLETDDIVNQARITRAMTGLWEKLSKPLENFAERMGDADAVFRDATVNNLREIVGILPSLNFMDDPTLASLGERIEKNLAVYEAKDLRTNKVVRAAVASEADKILRSMRGFMTAMGGSDDE